ncbi:hypothetical protein QT231_13900 [Halomonas sp. SpR1]|uniref:hypothetical protein n=1 Tax=Halomonas sp. SpR1 TaxID=3050462 RepID=UPI0027E54A96|nr:hypothetical protein [Halomonas sp. SpR1]MDQ7733802.1 hypothetical protein [Halomonas sp. SpR1]
MGATFRNNEDEYFSYPKAEKVAKEGSKYVVYDGPGNVLGAHPVNTIVEFTTDQPLKKDEG